MPKRKDILNIDRSADGVAVCVTGQRDCDQLIRAGRELADRTGGELIVMSALPRLYGQDTARVLEYLYECSAHVGAEMLVMYTDRPLEALTDGFKKRGIGHVLLGEPRRRSSQLRARLMGGYPGARYYSLDASGRAAQALQPAGCAL